MVILLVLTYKYGSAQIFDSYSINMGVAYSSQAWDYNAVSIGNQNKEYKIGILVFASGEKRLNRTLGIRSEIGYIQKGFKNNMELFLGDGSSAEVEGENVIFHDLGLNLGVKIAPRFEPSLYSVIGFRADYMLSYKDITYEESGSGQKISMYKPWIDEFNKINVGGLMAIGIKISAMMHAEIEYNPAITKTYSDLFIQIKDSTWGLKLGWALKK